jgi:hypothetical protein
MTDQFDITIAPSSSRRDPALVAVGLVGGFVLGVVARVWMRLISDKPEFTWAGTLFIVLGFAVFGLVQSTVAIARHRTMHRRTLTLVRAVGIICMLPLFFAAGAVMFPTVFGAGLALARHGWHSATRLIFAVVAAGPVLFVGRNLVHEFGWSIQTAAGFVSMLVIYATIIWATRFAFAAAPADRTAASR